MKYAISKNKNHKCSSSSRSGHPLGPRTNTKLCVTIPNRLFPSVALCGCDHLELNRLVDLVRAVIDERNVNSTFACVGQSPLLVI